jgi:2-keto-myo-inositol isomerase
MTPIPSTNALSRRDVLARTGLFIGSALLTGLGSGTGLAADETGSKPIARPFRFCLNTATIRGQKLGLVKEIEIAAQAGYEGIEPWVESIDAFKKAGGKLGDVKKQLADAGVTVESAIGFPEWIVDDDARRAKGLERAKYEMDLVAQIGGKRVAAPPAGATNTPNFDLYKAADRYRALLEAGDQIGIVPQLELWGFSQNMHRLSECAMVAMQAGHPKACVLLDIFHMYKGGSDPRGLRLLSDAAVPVLHMNDYPDTPPREKIDDSFRCYPGDGVGPVLDVLRLLHAQGREKVLSLELFSRKYWAQDALEVARTGLAKMKAVASKALEPG